MNPVRGRIYRADIGFGLKPFLVVSSNVRNGKLDNVLAVRLTTTPKPDIPTVVELGPDDACAGSRVLCDDVVTLYKDEITADLGAVSRRTMELVGAGLKAALSLS